MTDDSALLPTQRSGTAAPRPPAVTAGEHYRALFDDVADAMLILDDDRVIREANRAAGVLLGASPAELVGRPFDAFLVRDDREPLATCWRELLAFGEAKREHRLQSRHGLPSLIECSYRAVQGGRHVCIARDITDRRLLEERLVQTQRIESIGRLAGGIAHDFNNLLTAILGYAELLLNQRGPHDPDRSDLQEIQKAGQRAAALTQQLLAFSRKQVLVPRDVDLNGVIVNLKDLLSRAIHSNVQLTCETAPGPAIVRIDPVQLEQAVTALVLNSNDALPGGGRIHLEIAKVRLSSAEVPSDQSAPAGEYVRLRVIDDGVGIPLEAQTHLFEPFFTTKEIGKGTGLGLASVYGIVRQSNGFIWVESALGRGATFTMHFPIAESAMGDTASAPTADANRETVLLVEDEESVRALVSAVLTRHGYRVLEAADPVEAMSLFATHGADVHLLLSDVVMPGMTGPELARRLLSRRADLRVLFISGFTDGESPIDGRIANAGFLSKPFSASVLVNKLREMVGRPVAGTPDGR